MFRNRIIFYLQQNKKKKMNFVQVKNRLPDELALKISTEYSPAPDSEQDRVFFCITIIQQVDNKAWIYMRTFVTINNTVIPTSTRKYPRELEHALMNYAESLQTTLLNSEIQFEPSPLNCWNAGLIGPLTRKQDRCKECSDRKFTSFSITTKNPLPFQERRPDNTTNINYVQGLIRQSIARLNTRNRISVYSVHKHNKFNKLTMWMSLRKPVFPLSRVLSKSYSKIL